MYTKVEQILSLNISFQFPVIKHCNFLWYLNKIKTSINQFLYFFYISLYLYCIYLSKLYDENKQEKLKIRDFRHMLTLSIGFIPKLLKHTLYAVLLILSKLELNF